ncbi:ABC transporter permease [Planotetraspora mira]|jgi:peptide/nickel transport system permease protein|uniref:Peptide ABC transporter permease n=1 Tax=Planotetraspora mira TaxID=58121 RepID=A0A8J3TVX6_9ACTN|nr:ABC transporter permease [Planotetraspora mira]GII33895.1 peptide ABC transporter permease [Planotetraspora mira]
MKIPTSGRWPRFALRRAARLLVSLWVLVTAAFLMIHLVPGDPVRAALGPTAPADLVLARKQELGLLEPLWRQYVTFLRHLLNGELGVSISSRLPVGETIAQRLPATAQLAVAAFLLAVAVAVPVGVVMAMLTRRGRGRRTELAFTGTNVVVGAIPDFLLGVGLVYLLAVQTHLFPVAGRDGLDSYVLPVLALAIGPAAVLSRIVRVEMLAVLETDYVRTARAKRLTSLRVHLVHALPNAVTASLTLGGLLLSSLVAGTVLVENVFAWPGLGSSIVSSIVAKDYPMVQGTVLVYGAGVLLVNTLVDVVLALLDPRSAIGES